jgi:hypothetical protein
MSEKSLALIFLAVILVSIVVLPNIGYAGGIINAAVFAYITFTTIMLFRLAHISVFIYGSPGPPEQMIVKFSNWMLSLALVGKHTIEKRLYNMSDDDYDKPILHDRNTNSTNIITCVTFP